MFAGLMSRWTRPRDSASDSEWQTCRRMWIDALGRQRPDRGARASPGRGRRAAPSRSRTCRRRRRRSRTAPPCAATAGCAMTCASRSKRRTASSTPRPAPRPSRRRPNQLDRRRPRQQAVLGAPHFAHAALSEPLDQPVAAELPCARHLGAEAVDHARADVRHDDHQQVGKDEPEEELERVTASNVGAIVAMPMATITGTELTAASAVTIARRGLVGTTTVKHKTQTATHDSPRNVWCIRQPHRIEKFRGRNPVAADAPRTRGRASSRSQGRGARSARSRQRGVRRRWREHPAARTGRCRTGRRDRTAAAGRTPP